MCNPLQKIEQVQAQAPIVVQAEQQEVEQVQALAVQQIQQEQEQRAQQVQQTQRPAAPVDAAPTRTQRKKKTEEVAPLSREQVRENYSDVRKNAFQENLLQNVQLDMKLRGSKQYKAVMDAIKAYASMNLESTSTDKQSVALAKARKLLHRHPATPDAQDPESVIINRYRLYFDTFTDGQLELPSDMEQECCVDYSQKEFERTSIAAGIKPSWVDMKDQPLFAHEPSVNDVQQRLLGDCYLEAAISSLVLNTPEKLKECLRDNGDGTVTVRFFKKGCDEIIDLPTFVQKRALESDPTKLSDQDLLVRLFVDWKKVNKTEADQISKAYFKHCGNLGSALQSTPEYREKTLELSEQILQETDKQKKEELEKELENLPKKTFELAVERIGLQDLLHSMDLNHLPQAEALAAQVCADPEFAPMLETINQARQSGLNVTEVLKQMVQQFETVTPITNRLKTEKKELFDLSQSEVATHPVYVTVKKTVPRLAGVDAYTANSLWVQMIQKAYAASGLHIKDNEKRAEGKRNYKQIEGGHSDDFLETLTGIPKKRVSQQGITPLEKFVGRGGDLDPLSMTWRQNEMKSTMQIDPKMIAVVQAGLRDQLKHRYLRSYTTKGEQVRYAKSALTIEDLRETMADWRNWKTHPEKYMDYFRDVRNEHPDDDEYVDEQMRKIADYMESFYANLDIPGLEYRRFAQNVDGTPKYTRWAAMQYDAMRQALEHGKPVSVGTQSFIPEKIQGHGLNGESMEAGFVQQYAYSVVGCEEIDGRKYVTLRNPWARMERRYVKVTEKDGRVHYDVKANTQGLFAQSDNSGTFHMELNDFMNAVDDIYFNE